MCKYLCAYHHQLSAEEILSILRAYVFRKSRQKESLFFSSRGKIGDPRPHGQYGRNWNSQLLVVSCRIMNELIIYDLWMELDEANSLNIIFDHDDRAF